MPLAFKRSGNTTLGNLYAPELPEYREPPSFNELLGAAWRQENTIGSFLNREHSVEAGIQDAQFDAFDYIGGTKYEEYATSFIHADSQDDVAKIEAQIDRELQDRETLARGGLLGFGAAFAAGAVDPLLLITVGGATRTLFSAGKNFLKNAAIVGRAGFIGATATEAAFHATQETRTFGESVGAISAATFLSGVIGGTLGVLTGSQRARAIATVEDMIGRNANETRQGFRGGAVAGGIDPDDIVIPSAAFEADTAGPFTGGETQTEAAIKSALGLEKLVAPLNPHMRVAVKSPYATSRRVVQELADTSLFYEENAIGVATPVSVEADVLSYYGNLGRAVSTMDNAFVKYRTGKVTQGIRTHFEMAKIALRDFSRKDRAIESIENMTYPQFRRLAGKIARTGDTLAAIPEVEESTKAFRELVFDPIKDRAIELGMLPEDVDVETALSYLTRVWRKDMIRERRPILHTRTKEWLRTRRYGAKEKPIPEDQLDQVADVIIERLLGISPGRTGYDQGLPGPLKGRTFVIPDEAIEDFLESDIGLVSEFYVRTMAPDLELTARFGSSDMADALDRIKAEAASRINKARTPEEAKLLGEALENDLRDIQAMRDRLRGFYKAPDDPEGGLSRVGRAIRKINFFTVGGGFMPSSIPDVANVVFWNGIDRFIGDGVAAFIKNPKVFRLAAEEVKLAGGAWEIALNRRARSLADLGDEYGRHSRFEQGLNSLADNFSLVTLLSPWNEYMKLFSSVVVQARMLDTSAAWKAGRIAAKDIEKLARSGIDKDMAIRISDQFDRYGNTIDGIRLANSLEWDDMEAVRVFRAALRKDVDSIILTPGVGDRSLWMSTQMGALLGQFKSFAFAATHRIGIAQLQQRDAASLNGALIATALGMMVYAQKTLQAGRDPFAVGPLTWIKEGVDRSGLTGIGMDVNNTIEKASRGRWGISALIGGPTASRYASRNVLGAFAGPTAGRILTSSQVVGAIATGEFSKSDARAVRRMIPYQSVFYLDWLFDQAEKGLNAALVRSPKKKETVQ